MTIRACQFIIFIQNSGNPIFDFWLMTLITIYRNMGAFELKSGIVVIKIASIPFLKTMASFTISDTHFFKLIAMRIFVTRSTLLV
jgi:hypothetical protein